MKRQRGRNNGRMNNSSNNKPHLPVRSQTFDSNGPDVRIRGNAYQVLEKYLALARDAQSAGDRVAAENYYQHAEHYYRLISANGGHDRPQNPQQQGPNGEQRPQDGQPQEGQPQEAAFGQGPQPDIGSGPQPVAGETPPRQEPQQGF